ncbi:MAG TPA: orotate phosphoribosyltransferase [Flavobacteriaceae bacterium]|nr:orotate phosphoribosyltransferase [Flavobacteriaceae bacterium]
MILDTRLAEKTAELLLQIKAIKLNPQEPFTWSSGWRSPIYCDNRIILSYPAVRNFIKENLAQQLLQKYEKPDVIAGVATGAIGIGALVAEQLDLPFVYVRPEPKKHGRQNQIEGALQPGQTVVVIEDLISTGKSSLNAVNALKRADAKIMGMLAIFTYGFDLAKQNFKRQDIECAVLSDYKTLIKLAVEKEVLKPEEQQKLEAWRENPSEW